MGNQLPQARQLFTAIFSSEEPQDLYDRLDDFLSLEMTDEFVVRLIDQEAWFELMSKRPKQLEIFVRYLILHLDSVSSESLTQTHRRYIQNILRILTRIVPILHEARNRTLADTIFWTRPEHTQAVSQQAQDSLYKQAILNTIAANKNEANLKLPRAWCYGIRLVNALISLFFMPKFTVQYINLAWQSVKQKDQRFANNNSIYYESRILLLKLLLALFSETLYHERGGALVVEQQGARLKNPWLAIFISPQNRNIDLAVRSLLGEIVQYETVTGLKGGAVGTKGQYRVQRSTTKTQLAFFSAQVLCVMLNENVPLVQDSSIKQGNGQFQQSWPYCDAIAQQILEYCEYTRSVRNLGDTIYQQVNPLPLLDNRAINIFQDLRQGMALSREDLPALLGYLLTLLEEPLRAETRLIKLQTERPLLTEEILALVYRLLQHSPDVLQIVSESKDFSLRTFRITLYHFAQAVDAHDTWQNLQQDGCQNMQQIFFITLAIFLQLSQTRTFASFLNCTVDFSSVHSRLVPVVAGSHTDLLFQSIAAVTIDSFCHRYNIYTYNMLSIMFNVAPFVKNMSSATAHKLMMLLRIFTNYEFILLDHFHPACLVKLLTIIDKILSFQVEQNAELLVQMYIHRQLFNRALNLTFEFQQIKQVLCKTYKIDETLENEKLPFIRLVQNFFNNGPNFDWKSLRAKIPQHNILQTLAGIDSYVKAKNLAELDGTTMHLIISELGFVGVVKVADQIYIELFQDNTFMHEISNSFVWKQQPNLFPARKQQELQNSVCVEPPSHLYNAGDLELADNKLQQLPQPTQGNEDDEEEQKDGREKQLQQQQQQQAQFKSEESSSKKGSSQNWQGLSQGQQDFSQAQQDFSQSRKTVPPEEQNDEDRRQQLVQEKLKPLLELIPELQVKRPEFEVISCDESVRDDDDFNDHNFATGELQQQNYLSEDVKR